MFSLSLSRARGGQASPSVCCSGRFGPFRGNISLSHPYACPANYFEPLMLTASFGEKTK